MVREHAEEWFTKPDRIAVCGFSAGGHLAASLGVWYDNPVFTEVYGKADNLRPDAMILCYPVITADQFAHAQSIESVSGSPFGTEEYRRFGLNQYVNDQTPPTFLWHSASDQAVPVENSLKMAEALSRHHVPYELHGLLLHPDAPPLLDTLIIPAIDTCAYRGLISVSLRQFRTTWDSLG